MNCIIPAEKQGKTCVTALTSNDSVRGHLLQRFPFRVRNALNPLPDPQGEEADHDKCILTDGGDTHDGFRAMAS